MPQTRRGSSKKKTNKRPSSQIDSNGKDASEASSTNSNSNHSAEPVKEKISLIDLRRI